MTQGVRALHKTQLGREATAGTAVAATTIWRGVGDGERTNRWVMPKEDIGIAVPSTRAYSPYIGAKYAMESTPATFEQLNHIFEAGIMTTTASADGGGTGKVYEYNVPETALNTLKTYTIEDGDNNVAKEMEYSFVTDFSLDGRCGEAWMVSANWQGRQWTVSSFTGALSVPTVEEILFSKTKLYLDAIGGTYGTTQKTATLLNASLKCTTGWVATCPGDGVLYFRYPQFSKAVYKMTLDILFEYEATAAAEEAYYAGATKTARKIQLLTEGSALGTPGTAYTYKSLVINLPGIWTKFTKLGEKDGNSVITGTFETGYDATAADAGQILLVNELASVP